MTDFATFWDQIPVKVDKGNAEKAFKAVLRAPEWPGALKAGEIYAMQFEAARRAGKEQFLKRPAAWLRAKGWLNEVPAKQESFNEGMKRQEIFEIGERNRRHFEHDLELDNRKRKAEREKLGWKW